MTNGVQAKMTCMKKLVSTARLPWICLMLLGTMTGCAGCKNLFAGRGAHSVSVSCEIPGLKKVAIEIKADDTLIGRDEIVFAIINQGSESFDIGACSVTLKVHQVNDANDTELVGKIDGSIPPLTISFKALLAAKELVAAVGKTTKPIGPFKLELPETATNATIELVVKDIQKRKLASKTISWRSLLSITMDGSEFTCQPQGNKKAFVFDPLELQNTSGKAMALSDNDYIFVLEDQSGKEWGRHQSSGMQYNTYFSTTVLPDEATKNVPGVHIRFKNSQAADDALAQPQLFLKVIVKEKSGGRIIAVTKQAVSQR